jgi:hypothetical protein
MVQILSDEARGGISQETEIKEHLHDWRPHREHAVMGIFWWNAMLLDYIASPNRRLRGLITRAKADLGWTHPIIGMHVRRGDSCDLKASPVIIKLQDLKPHIAINDILPIAWALKKKTARPLPLQPKDPS